MEKQIRDLKEMKKFAAEFGKTLKGGEIIALKGELGAGKTAFVKFLLSSKGIDKKILSPTFVLMVPYKKSGEVYYHMDLYRTKSIKEIRALGTDQLWGKKNNIFLIEWADKIKKHLPKSKTTFIKFRIKGHGRVLEIKK